MPIKTKGLFMNDFDKEYINLKLQQLENEQKDNNYPKYNKLYNIIGFIFIVVLLVSLLIPKTKNSTFEGEIFGSNSSKLVMLNVENGKKETFKYPNNVVYFYLSNGLNFNTDIQDFYFRVNDFKNKRAIIEYTESQSMFFLKEKKIISVKILSY